MQVKLHLVRGNPQGKQVEVPPGTLTVGRAEDSDLIVASTRVSRHHCEIINEQTRVLARDKGSANGTLVNGAKIQNKVLAPGDLIQVGPLTFQIEIDGKRQRPGQPAAAPIRIAKPLGQAKAAPAKPVFKFPPGKAPKADILASLEKMAQPKKPTTGKGKDSGVIKISEEDLLDADDA